MRDFIRRVLARLHLWAEAGWSGSAVGTWGLLQGSVVPGPSEGVLIPLGLADPRRALYLAIWAVAGASQSLGGVFFFAIGVAAAQALWHWRLIRDRTREGCFKAFRLNHWLGFTVFAGVAAGYALRP